MKKQILKHSLISSLTVFLLTACTSFSPVKPAIQVDDAGQVVFSDIRRHTVAKGLQVSGNVLKKTSSGKRITIPGHIHIVLIGKDGKQLEIINARTHQQYGNSRLWHFDGVLKTLVPKEGRIIVKYHNKHLPGKR